MRVTVLELSHGDLTPSRNHGLAGGSFCSHQQTGVLLYHIIFILLYYTHYDTVILHYNTIILLIFLQMSGLLFFIISLSPKGLLFHL